MTALITRVLTAGNSDPAGPPIHENNTWLIGDDAEVVVIDPAHDANAVLAVVGDRRVVAVLITHGHWDHIRKAAELGHRVGVTPRMHPADAFLWREELGDEPFDELSDGAVVKVAGTGLKARHTPGHTPGSTSILADDLGAVFTGDTLFPGGPGATRWDYSSFDTIIESLEGLFTLPDDTVVHPGHGDSTTIGTEAPHLEEWIERGW